MLQIMAALLLVSLISLGCERIETVETDYLDSAAANKADAVGDGKWIPGILPHSAKKIRETHNIDTNEIWLFFNFSADDRDSITKACQRIAEHEVIYPRKSPRTWWPQTLTKRSKDTHPTSETYEYYRCKDGGSVAIHGDAVFYWHSGRL